MPRLRRLAFVSSTLGAILVACTGGGGTTTGGGGVTGTGAFSFTATADGPLPSGGKVLLIWSVSSGSPDYSYSFGSGSLQGGQVQVSFPSSPPTEALNGGKLGIAILAVVDPSVEIPEGKLTKGQVQALSLVAPRHAVVFRNTSEVALKNGWDSAFPQGFACGQCVDHDSGFDSFEVVDCQAIRLVPYSKEVKFCNWT